MGVGRAKDDIADRKNNKFKACGYEKVNKAAELVSHSVWLKFRIILRVPKEKMVGMKAQEQSKDKIVELFLYCTYYV